jgi:predicted lipid-binding transport protein (Tim44 family)
MGLYALLIVTAGAVAAPDETLDVARDLERAVHSIQTAFNKGDVDTLRVLMTDDHLTILTYAYFSNREDQLKLLSEFRFAEYRVDDLEVRGLTENTAVVTYRATIRGTYRKRKVPSPVHVGEVWVKRDGKWLQASYQETPGNTH